MKAGWLPVYDQDWPDEGGLEGLEIPHHRPGHQSGQSDCETTPLSELTSPIVLCEQIVLGDFESSRLVAGTLTNSQIHYGAMRAAAAVRLDCVEGREG